MKVNPIDLIEYGVRMAKPDRVPRTQKEGKPPNIGELIFQKRRELAELEQVYKDLEKLNKKEDDKKKPNGWNVDTLAMLLLSITPINWVVLYLLLK